MSENVTKVAPCIYGEKEGCVKQLRIWEDLPPSACHSCKHYKPLPINGD